MVTNVNFFCFTIGKENLETFLILMGRDKEIDYNWRMMKVFFFFSVWAAGRLDIHE